MTLTLGRDLDPLDLELVERAFECVLGAIETDSAPDEFETDEEFEIALRRELAEMVRSSGISDVDALLDLLLEDKSRPISAPQGSICVLQTSNHSRHPVKRGGMLGGGDGAT